MSNHPVTSRPMGQSEERKHRAPRIGFIRPGQVERAFVVLLYISLAILVFLSVLGTFYGRRGEDAPIATPLLILSHAIAAPGAFGIAIAIQFVLTITQYGARQMAGGDRRWWILYLVALGFSVYYNYHAYWTPLTAIVPAYLAGLFIVAGDILPEFIAVRRE